MKTQPAIEVRNAQRKLRVDLAALQAFAGRTLTCCLALPPRRGGDLRTLTTVSVLLVSDRRIAELHQRFMNIAGPTDVITFQHGEIFVSVETARRQARAFRTSSNEEIRLYLIHGLLHLHGFDDTTPAQARAMEIVQQRILSAVTGE